jgi:hypothetical protein
MAHVTINLQPLGRGSFELPHLHRTAFGAHRPAVSHRRARGTNGDAFQECRCRPFLRHESLESLPSVTPASRLPSGFFNIADIRSSIYDLRPLTFDYSRFPTSFSMKKLFEPRFNSSPLSLYSLLVNDPKSRNPGRNSTFPSCRTCLDRIEPQLNLRRGGIKPPSSMSATRVADANSSRFLLSLLAPKRRSNLLLSGGCHVGKNTLLAMTTLAGTLQPGDELFPFVSVQMPLPCFMADPQSHPPFFLCFSVFSAPFPRS